MALGPVRPKGHQGAQSGNAKNSDLLQENELYSNRKQAYTRYRVATEQAGKNHELRPPQLHLAESCFKVLLASLQDDDPRKTQLRELNLPIRFW